MSGVKKNVHGQIIAAAAKRQLSPLGFERKGRSRLWFSDEQFWQIGVEFQPSQWSKGSYLNVGACWLWEVRDHFSFDTGPGRLGRFEEFENEDQFSKSADALATLAANEATTLRKRFSSLSSIAAELEADARGKKGHRVYHAAIANGLVGRTLVAREFFEQWTAELEKQLLIKPLMPMPPEFRQWQEKSLELANQMIALLEMKSDFQQAIERNIEICRSLRGLSTLQTAIAFA